MDSGDNTLAYRTCQDCGGAFVSHDASTVCYPCARREKRRVARVYGGVTESGKPSTRRRDAAKEMRRRKAARRARRKARH